jgi:DNA-3-methyladenine glycosylase
MSRREKLPPEFFQGPDVVEIAVRLLGKRLFTRISDSPGGSGRQAPIVGGIIVETEAYSGVSDRASHAFGNKLTRRTEVMFRKGGTAYVYLCYGIHCLFNIVTNVKGVPDAVLVRAIEPTDGIEVMIARRGKPRLDRSLAGGPGALCAALGIGVRHSGTSVSGDEIWLESGSVVPSSRVVSAPRVGVGYAGKDASRPWRFMIRNSPWTSPAK